MTLADGTKLGPHEILSPLGAGGMGEIYRARDSRLDRLVAIKVLPTHLSTNPELRQRFEREARAISSLNHPHICTLYDVGRENDVDFLVLELIEGESLAERLKRGAIPREEVLRHAVEIADALSKAHRAGVVHRDLKPGNVMLTRHGTKLVDFGLAAWMNEPGASDEDSALSSLATAHKGLTEQGAVLGTFQYMAPEQLEGKSVDARTDIFALGVVLYEMLTGEKAFDGKSSASLIATILERDLRPVSEIQPASPPVLDHVIRRCVAKDPDERWQSAQDVKAELEWIREGSTPSIVGESAVAPRKREYLAWSLLAVTAVALALAFVRLTSDPPATELVRFTVPPPDGGSFTRFGGFPVFQALSPDGRQLAFAARSSGEGPRLWVRSLDSLAARSLPGTEGADYHFWSPDSRFLAFFAEGKLKKVGLDGGPAQTLAPAPDSRGGTWSSEDVILFTPDSSNPLFVVRAVGGEPTPVTELDEARGDTSHRFPSFLPDGRHFLYTLQAGPFAESAGIYLGSLDGDASKRLLPDVSQAVYAEPGYVLFVRENTLIAHPFDAHRLELSGEPVPIADSVAFSGGLSIAGFSASSRGTLAYHPGSTVQRLAWFDRAGRRDEIDQPGFYRSPALSPDGRRLAVERSEGGPFDIWILDLERGTNSRFTFDPGVDWYPIWSPDGQEIVFASNRSGRHALYRKKASGTGDEELLLETDEDLYPTDWSRDGRFILYASGQGAADRDIWALPLFGEREPMLILDTDFFEWRGSLSPDGKWFAYDSNETGQMEVYIQSFPPTGAKWQISVNGGQMSRWSADGKELFYQTEAGRFMAVEVSGGQDLQAGRPTPLFEIEGFIGPNLRFAMTEDAGRFLIPTSPVGTDSAVHVVLNWTKLLE